MSRPLRLYGAAALLMACVLGGLGAGTLFAGAALADDGSGSAPAPVSVTIPGNGGSSNTPTPTPSSTPSSPSRPPVTDRGGGGAGDASPPPHQPNTEPSIPGHPATGTLKVTIAPQGVFRSGDRMTVSATGFDAREKVQLVLYYSHGKPIKIGNFAADASGSFSQSFVLPKLDAGTDTVQLSGWRSSKIGTGSFLLGANWVVPTPSSERAIWLWVGGLAGLAALVALVWFGFASLRRSSAAEAGV